MSKLPTVDAGGRVQDKPKLHAADHIDALVDPIPEATTSTPGLMAAADKTALDNIAVFAGAGADGLVPDPVTENGLFLKDDSTWAAAGIAKATSNFPMSIGGTAAYARDQTGYMTYHGFYVAEVNAQQCVPAGKVVHACLRVGANTVADATVVTVFKNGVATTMTFTIPAATAGYFSTETNPITVAKGDFISFRIAIGIGNGTQNINFRGGEIWLEVTE